MNKAAFQLMDYKFDKIELNFADIPTNPNMVIEFNPSGIFKENESIFALTFEFNANIENIDSKIISIRCVSLFKFNEKISFDEIPDYFYSNIIAILFPYIRAFVSTISLQANIRPIIIPTLNLSALREDLIAATKIQ